MKRQLCIALLGPTASGKTAFAIEMAKILNGEIVALDSTTVYQEFNIGSSKPAPSEQEMVPHHLIDVLSPQEEFSVFHFVKLANERIDDILNRNKVPIVVGGTYFYFRALQYGVFPVPAIPKEIIEDLESEYIEDEKLNTVKMHAALKEKDPLAAANIHPMDRYRLLRSLAIIRTTGKSVSALKPEPLSESQKRRLWVKYCMLLPRHQVSQNIALRTEILFQKGLIAETKSLLEKFPQSRALSSIGYREVVTFLKQTGIASPPTQPTIQSIGQPNVQPNVHPNVHPPQQPKMQTEKQLKNEIIEKTRQLAKRQITWIRSDSEIRFVDGRDLDRISLEVSNLRFTLQQTTAETA